MSERLHLKNFRSFLEPGPLPVSRLTLLVGENSSGKSAFLAGYRIARDICNGNVHVDFNEPPFDLGSYDQIAHFRGGRGGRRQYFEVGLDVRTENITNTRVISSVRLGSWIRRVATFRAGQFQPYASSLEYSSGRMSLSLENLQYWPNSIINFRSTRHSVRINIKEILPTFLKFPTKNIRFFGLILDMILEEIKSAEPSEQDPHSKFDQTSFKAMRKFASVIQEVERDNAPRPIAFAPVRTKPSRTYNPMSEAEDPEGGHVPMLIARLAMSSEEEWEKVREPLEKFGEASGLFRHLRIRRFGKKGADPFQIQIQALGQPANIVDVGYGVSQILPFLVETLRSEKGKTFLLQQPEVHLHPRAQAELGSFVSSLITERKHNILIETHSDYLIDRVRWEVRERKNGLSHQDCGILYFERGGHEVQVHPIGLDDEGNLLNVPQGYRDFFLEETNRILGID